MAFYETCVYYEQPVVATEVPEGLLDLRAETCGVCHKAIYEEWSIAKINALSGSHATRHNI